jgi:hypothetical protein
MNPTTILQISKLALFTCFDIMFVYLFYEKIYQMKGIHRQTIVL